MTPQSNISLNDFLETRSPLESLLWNPLIRNRFWPILLWKDIQKAFLQFQIWKAEGNTLRFHWVKSLESEKIKVSRFSSLVFVLTQSPFILEGTLQIHFENYWHEFEETVNRIEKDVYIDDLVRGGGML